MTETNAVALSAKTMISKIRRHIEYDKCKCCAEALNETEVVGVNQRTQPPIDEFSHQQQPAGRQPTGAVS
jgi:hypothetical protein